MQEIARLALSERLHPIAFPIPLFRADATTDDVSINDNLRKKIFPFY